MLAARKYQRGASIWMILLMVIVLGFAAIFGLKVIPMFIESYKIDKALEGTFASDVSGQSVNDIRDALLRRLDIDDVRRIERRNWRDYMTITKRDRKVTVEVFYDAEEHLFGNLYIIGRFDKSKSN